MSSYLHRASTLLFDLVSGDAKRIRYQKNDVIYSLKLKPSWNDREGALAGVKSEVVFLWCDLSKGNMEITRAVETAGRPTHKELLLLAIFLEEMEGCEKMVES